MGFSVFKKKNKASGIIEHGLPVLSNQLHVIPSNYQHIGDRENQEDAFAISDLGDHHLTNNSGVLALVCDGMGGLSYGEEASRVAAKCFLKEYMPVKPNELPSVRLHRALLRSNTAVYDLAYKDGQEIELGTTIVATLICESDMYWIAAGDSRIYHHREASLIQLNRDHTYKNQLLDKVKQGIVTREEADSHPEGAYLTSFLGLSELMEIAYNSEPLKLQTGDHILLCSDGLTNTLDDEEINSYLNRAEQITAEELVKHALAKKQPYQDNITAILLTCNFDN